ncbi:MAG: acetyl-CoA carboxylase carboxyltransferase subunit alpha [Endomicrobiia bacterium]
MPEELLPLEFEKPIVELENKIQELQKSLNEVFSVEKEKQLKKLKEEYEKIKKEIYSNLTPSQKVQLARHPKRPYTLDYINLLFTDFIELHGDRNFSDDKAIIAGIGMFENIPVVIIGQQKGKNLQENLERNFGMPHPEGYRKALRIMKLAEKFSKPIISFIDTPGAYPGIGAEERGQSEAIARNLKEMSILKTPIISIVIGEGGSGGALGIGVTDRILMLENSVYFVCTPEACSAILFRDSTRSEEAASALKLTAQDLYKFGVVDEIIPEPEGGAHRDVKKTAENIRISLRKNILELSKIPISKLLEERYKKYRSIGVFSKKGVKNGSF